MCYQVWLQLKTTKTQRVALLRIPFEAVTLMDDKVVGERCQGQDIPSPGFLALPSMALATVTDPSISSFSL